MDQILCVLLSNRCIAYDLGQGEGVFELMFSRIKCWKAAALRDLYRLGKGLSTEEVSLNFCDACLAGLNLGSIQHESTFSSLFTTGHEKKNGKCQMVPDSIC